MEETPVSGPQERPADSGAMSLGARAEPSLLGGAPTPAVSGEQRMSGVHRPSVRAVCFGFGSPWGCLKGNQRSASFGGGLTTLLLHAPQHGKAREQTPPFQEGGLTALAHRMPLCPKKAFKLTYSCHKGGFVSRATPQMGGFLLVSFKTPTQRIYPKRTAPNGRRAEPQKQLGGSPSKAPPQKKVFLLVSP